MAITLTKHTILDGARNLVVKVHFDSSDTTEAAAAILINASDYGVTNLGGQSPRPDGTNPFRLMKLEAEGNDAMDIELLWDATTPVSIVNIPIGVHRFVKDWRDVGGIPNDAGSGITGDIKWTTTGMTTGSLGQLTFWLKKRGPSR